MKCVLVPSHGEDIDNLLTMSTDHPKPKRASGEVLIKVQACALAPGDIRVMKGHCDYFQEPPTGFPYIPGGDIAGTVEDADEGSRFQKGDRVLAMFEIPRPLGGLAEYACAKESLVEVVPDGINAVRAACLTSSALAAYNAASLYVLEGSRVLILGGSGGVGTFLVQMAKNAGASYIAVTSTDEKLVKSLGADRVINYKQENFWDIAEFKDDPFDIIFDLGVGRYESWQMSRRSEVLKNAWRGGKYVTFSGDEPEMKIHNLWQTLKFINSIFMRVAWTAVWRFAPKYIHMSSGLDIKPGIFRELLNLVEDGKVEVILDHASSYSFDLESVKRAFHVMNRRAAHGKVVLEITT